MFDESHVKSFKQLSKSQYEVGISCVICKTENNYVINRNVFRLSFSCV